TDARRRPAARARRARGHGPAICGRRCPRRDRRRSRHATRSARGRRVSERVGVAIVGGGPAGAALAARLARAGRSVVVLERAPAWRWRAGGVFSSPAAMAALRRVGVTDATLAAAARPIPAMRVETSAGTTFRLTYGADTGGEPAVGFDRCR